MIIKIQLVKICGMQVKQVIGGKFIASIVYVRKERPVINILSFLLKKLEKQIESKVDKRNR